MTDLEREAASGTGLSGRSTWQSEAHLSDRVYTCSVQGTSSGDSHGPCL